MEVFVKHKSEAVVQKLRELTEILKYVLIIKGNMQNILLEKEVKRHRQLEEVHRSGRGSRMK